jgi:hypothetical protein
MPIPFQRFIFETLHAARGKPAGLQHAHDPEIMLGVIQLACRTHQDTNLTQTEIDRIYGDLQQEALDYHNRFPKYVETADYKDYLADIKKMLDRMKEKDG